MVGLGSGSGSGSRESYNDYTTYYLLSDALADLLTDPYLLARLAGLLKRVGDDADGAADRHAAYPLEVSK